jgi:hypothetical protein
MRLLICGSRDWNDYELIRECILRIGVPNIACIIQGEARGADLMAKSLALEYDIKHADFPADWDVAGPGAGPRRNQRMLDEGKPTHVLAFHDAIHTAKGTGDMIQRAEAARVPVALVSHRNECGWILNHRA